MNAAGLYYVVDEIAGFVHGIVHACVEAEPFYGEAVSKQYGGGKGDQHPPEHEHKGDHDDRKRQGQTSLAFFGDQDGNAVSFLNDFSQTAQQCGKKAVSMKTETGIRFL